MGLFLPGSVWAFVIQTDPLPTLRAHGRDGLSYVIMNIQQKTKKEDLKNEYTLEE